MRRYSLVILVFFLLILNTLMQRAAGANPLTHPNLWELRHALPAGVAGAALLLVVMGMGAQTWQGILPAGGARWSPQRSWSYIATCGLWFGWIPLLCALTLFPHPTEEPPPLLFYAFVILILCRLINRLSSHVLARLFSGALTAAIAVLCGQVLWPSTPLDVLVMGLAAAAALHLLSDREPAPPFMWLMAAALIFCAYAAAFGYMLSFYAPTAATAATPWGMWMACGYIALGLAIIIFAPLRRTTWGRRSVAALSLLATAVWLWLHFTPQLAEQEQLPAVGLYALAIVLFGIPSAMLLRSSAEHGEH